MNIQAKLSIDRIFSTIAEKNAADLHLSVGAAPMLRVTDELVPLPGEPVITQEFMETLVDSTLDMEQRAILQKQREIVVAFQLNPQSRFRINIFYQRGLLAAYVRLIGNAIKSIDQLGLPPSIEQFTQATKGLIIISGTFGSGKTTTSAALIEYINKHTARYILTVERPIEYVFQSQKSIVEQREVGRDVLTFEQALRTITQEDVDVLFVSEFTNANTIDQLLAIAASGRLVIANVEADTTVKTLEHIINRYPGNEQQRVREQLAANLMGIVCQRLVPRVGGGVVPVAEILISTPPIQAHIKEGSLYQLSTVIQTSRAEGMVSLDWALAELVKTNEITFESALTHASDEQQLRSVLNA